MCKFIYNNIYIYIVLIQILADKVPSGNTIELSASLGVSSVTPCWDAQRIPAEIVGIFGYWDDPIASHYMDVTCVFLAITCGFVSK